MSKELASIVFGLGIICSGMSFAANDTIFELDNKTSEAIHFALSEVGADPDGLESSLQEIKGKKAVKDKIGEDQRQILIKLSNGDRFVYELNVKKGKNIRLKFTTKSVMSKETELMPQVITNNISKDELVKVKEQIAGTVWNDVKVEKSKAADPKKEETKPDPAKEEGETKEAEKSKITPYQLLGANARDEGTKERQILGFGTAAGGLVFSEAMGSGSSIFKDKELKAQKKIEESCKKLGELWSGDGISKKDREKIMNDKKVPSDEQDELATDTHSLIEKTCESVKAKFPEKKDSGDDWGW